MTHRNDPALGRSFDGTVALRTRSGQQLTRSAVAAGIDPDKLLEKFTRLASGRIGEVGARDAAGALLRGIDWRSAAALLRAAAA